MLNSFFSLLVLAGLWHLPAERQCDQLPNVYENYDVAEQLVRTSNFDFQESIENTTTASWIRSASFYSCDHQSGYLIIQTERVSYLHQNVPMDIWNQFKKAGSFSGFYNQHVKGKYRLKVE